MFDKLIKMRCHSRSGLLKKLAGNLLEKLYCCEINCMELDRSVLFAHHARGSTIVAAKICANVVIFQNVTIGSNLRYNKSTREWENVGTPIIGKNAINGFCCWPGCPVAGGGVSARISARQFMCIFQKNCRPA